MNADWLDTDLSQRVQVGVGALVFNAALQVFLAKRGASAGNERGYWECPGGAVNFGEQLLDAVKREFMEEHGMIIDDLHLLTTVDHIIAEENQHWVSVIYVGTHHAGTPVICEPEKCSAIGWFDLDALPLPLSPASQLAVKAYETLQE